MSDYRILFAGSAPTVTRSVRRALVSAGHDLSCSGPDRETLSRRFDESFDMLVVDADMADIDALLWTINSFKKTSPDGAVLVLSSELGDREIVEQIASAGLNNLVGKHVGLSATRDHIDEAELIATVDKLLRRDVFGIDKYLPPRACVHPHVVGRSDERGEVLAQLESFLGDIDCYRSIQPIILTVADELLMNAVFSAPVDENGRAKYQELERRTAFTLAPNELVDFQYACDGRSVVVSVSDRFGSLDRDLLIGYLGSGFLGEKATVRQSSGGAGIGLYMIAHSITQLVFNIEKNVRTEVIATFYIRSGLRAFRESGQSLNLFVI